MLELNFYDAGEFHCLEHANGGFNDCRLINRLHAGTGPAEIHGELAQTARHQRGERATVLANGRIRELRLSPARDHFLYYQNLWVHECTRLVIPGQQRLAIIRAPGLGRSEPVKFVSKRRLEDHWEGTVGLGKLSAAPRVERPGMADLEFVRELVGQSLVVSPAQDVPRRGCKPEPLRQFGVVPRNQSGTLVTSWDKHPSLKPVLLG